MSISGDKKTALQGSLSSVASFSSSLDEESKFEEPLPRLDSDSLFIALDKELPGNPCSVKPAPDYSKNKNKNPKEQTSMSIPKIKLKPRPPRRSSARHQGAGYHSFESSPFKTPASKIFIPFLSSRSSYSSTQLQKQHPQNPMPPPPLIAQLSPPPSSNPSTPDGAKIRSVENTPLSLPRQKKAKWNRPASMPLSSPPLLIPSFDYGITAATREDAITPPPITKRPNAPLTTPPSVMTDNTPPIEDSVGTVQKRGRGTAVMAKPIARRPFITPSKPQSSSNDASTSAPSSVNSFSWNDTTCTPSTSLPSTLRHGNSSSLVAPLSSSVECSAFAFSSALPSSLLYTTIRRTLSADEAEELPRQTTSF